jgi:hypothetical protein
MRSLSGRLTSSSPELVNWIFSTCGVMISMSLSNVSLMLCWLLT